MADNNEPIFDFSPLKAFLQERGYRIGERKAYEPFTPEEVKPADVTNGRMEFLNDGIFVIDESGQRHQVFLYKKDYHLERYKKPRYHLCRCAVINEFIQSGGFNSHYVRANTDPVPVIDLDNRRRKEMVSGLPLCQYCQKLIGGAGSTTEFVRLLQQANNNSTGTGDVEVDLFGYTRDWETVSRKYRESKNYTCERCGFHPASEYDKQYIHTHHKDGNKLNNDVSNLECLCMKCHANVDENHKKRFSSGANRIIYRDFISTVLNVTIENHYHGEIDNLTINSNS